MATFRLAFFSLTYGIQTTTAPSRFLAFEGLASYNREVDEMDKNVNVCDVRTQGVVRDDASSHVHCVVPAGGLAPDHSRWVTQIAAAQKIVPNAAGNVFVPGTIVNSDVSAGPFLIS